MPLTIRLLIAEDSDADAELTVRELKKAGLRIAYKVVDTEQTYRQSLRSFGPDVILSDFSMPLFDGMAALQLARELTPEIPFIFVSGTLGEEYAIRALKNGASDYVLKTNLVRLPSAVERALTDAKAERQRRRLKTELEIARDRLQLSEAGLRRAQAVARLAHLITGPGGVFESWSETLPELIGEDPASSGRSVRSWLQRMDPAEREAFRNAALTAARTGERTEIDFRLERHGKSVHLRQVIEPLTDERAGTTAGRWFSTLQDVTEQKEAEERIRRLNRVYAVLSGINSLIVRAPSREELFAEACRIAVADGGFALARVIEYDSTRKARIAATSEVDSRLFQRIVDDYNDDPEHSPSLLALAQRSEEPLVSNDVASDLRIPNRAALTKEGNYALALLPIIVEKRVAGSFLLRARDAGMFDEDELHLLLEMVADMAFALDHIAKEERLNYLAMYDQLTGLANRTLFLERLNQFIQIARPLGNKVAVVITDVERLRTINESLGRSAGDAVIKEVAERFAREVGKADIARVGADHVALVLQAIKGKSEVTGRLEALWQRCFSEPFQVSGADLKIAAKAGIALFPNDGGEAELLLRNAEAALVRAKELGEQHMFYTSALTARSGEQLMLESRLRQALERAEFVLHYQPKLEMESRRVVGVEALIRWQSPELGLVPPMKFIPLMEETGLILDVGDWALKKAIADHLRWTNLGLSPPRVAVNVSAIQLRRRDFVSVVEAALECGATPPGIDLEITESLVMEDIESNMQKLKEIRSLGSSVAIDDFGTGYSSLGYLAKLPVQTLKIDRSFIVTMLKDPHTMTLVSTIISLAHSLRLKVVAEGVEQEEQAAMLKRLGCDEMQGYVFSRPIPFDQMTALLSEERRRLQ